MASIQSILASLFPRLVLLIATVAIAVDACSGGRRRGGRSRDQADLGPRFNFAPLLLPGQFPGPSPLQTQLLAQPPPSPQQSPRPGSLQADPGVPPQNLFLNDSPPLPPVYNMEKFDCQGNDIPLTASNIAGLQLLDVKICEVICNALADCKAYLWLQWPNDNKTYCLPKSKVCSLSERTRVGDSAFQMYIMQP